MTMPDHVPRLVDPPIVLRDFTGDDVALIQDVSTDPLIPLITTVPTTPGLEEARAFIDRQRARLAEGRGFSFAIADVDTDEAVGQSYLSLRSLRYGRASIGYWVAARHRGHGIGRHALRMVSRWGLRLPDIHRLELYIEPWNEASWRTAEHVGYQREGLLRSWEKVGDDRRDMYMYSLLRSDLQ